MPLNLPLTSGQAMGDPIEAQRYEILRAIGQQALKAKDLVGGSGIDITSPAGNQTPLTFDLGALDRDWAAGNHLINSRNSVTWLNAVEAFGMKGDGQSDNTPAFNAAIAYMVAHNVKTLFVPVGDYWFFSKPNNIGSGIVIRGEGSTGSTATVGFSTFFTKRYAEADNTKGFLTWDGSSANLAGTGGGMRDIWITNTSGAGGIGILLTGTDDSHRTGYMRFDNIRVTGGNNLFRCLVIDGSACTTVGTQGVRDMLFTNCVFGGGSDAGNTVYLKNGVHITFIGGDIIGAGGATPGITITGAGAGTSASTNVQVFGELECDITIDFSQQATISGVCTGAVTLTANALYPVLSGSFTNGVTNNSTSALIAFRNTGQAVIEASVPTGASRDLLFSGQSTRHARFGLSEPDAAGFAGSNNATPFQVRTNGNVRTHWDTAGSVGVGGITSGLQARMDINPQSSDVVGLNLRAGFGGNAGIALSDAAGTTPRGSILANSSVMSISSGTGSPPIALQSGGGQVAIGATTATSRLTVTDNTTAPVAAISNTTGHFLGADATVTRTLLDSFGAANAFTGRRANNTAASPTGVVADDVLAQMTGLGYTSAGAYSAGARADVQLRAAETWSGTIQGAYLDFRTTPKGSVNIAEVGRFDDVGRLWLAEGTATALTAQVGGAVFTQTADSTTTANTLTTLFGTGSGSLTLPANLLVAGRTIRIAIGGYVSTADGAAGTKTLTVTLGGTTVATGTSGATIQTLLNQEWLCDCYITCRTTGAPGTVQAGGRWYTQIAANGGSSGVFAASTATTNITTTGTLAVDVKFNNGNATGAITTTFALVEVIN